MACEDICDLLRQQQSPRAESTELESMSPEEWLHLLHGHVWTQDGDHRWTGWKDLVYEQVSGGRYKYNMDKVAKCGVLTSVNEFLSKWWRVGYTKRIGTIIPWHWGNLAIIPIYTVLFIQGGFLAYSLEAQCNYVYIETVETLKDVYKQISSGKHCMYQ